MNLLVSLDGISNQLFEKEYKIRKSLFPTHVYVKRLQTVNPSVTFPVHVSVMTGKHPASHGIFENVTVTDQEFTRIELYHLLKAQSREILKTETIFDKLVTKGIQCKTIHWPMAAGLLAKCVPESAVVHDDSNSVEYAKILDKKAYKELEDAMKGKKEDLIAVHFVEYDAAAHIYGVESKKTREALQRVLSYVDKILGKRNTYEVEYLLFFSDHGLISRTDSFFPNQYVTAHGYEEKWKKKQFRFLCDGSGSVLYYSHMTKREDEELLACLMSSGKTNHYEWIPERKFHLPFPKAIIDLKRGVCAEDIMPGEKAKYAQMKGIHGYHNQQVEEMDGFLLGFTKNKIKTQILEKRDVTDITETIAKFYDIDFKTEGQVIAEIL
ncbi:MAG: alkaline phosphatase family protein [Lachnospiraceae bacterium]